LLIKPNSGLIIDPNLAILQLITIFLQGNLVKFSILPFYGGKNPRSLLWLHHSDVMVFPQTTTRKDRQKNIQCSQILCFGQVRSQALHQRRCWEPNISTDTTITTEVLLLRGTKMLCNSFLSSIYTRTVLVQKGNLLIWKPNPQHLIENSVFATNLKLQPFFKFKKKYSLSSSLVFQKLSNKLIKV
jgi:hypothetical protein